MLAPRITSYSGEMYTPGLRDVIPGVVRVQGLPRMQESDSNLSAGPQILVSLEVKGLGGSNLTTTH